MLKIKIKHKIGDIVTHSFNGKPFKVIGYRYVEGAGVKYICLQSDKEDYQYLFDIELLENKERVLGFIG